MSTLHNNEVLGSRFGHFNPGKEAPRSSNRVSFLVDRKAGTVALEGGKYLAPSGIRL